MAATRNSQLRGYDVRYVRLLECLDAIGATSICAVAAIACAWEVGEMYYRKIDKKCIEAEIIIYIYKRNQFRTIWYFG